MESLNLLEGIIASGKSTAGVELCKRIPNSVLLSESVDEELLTLFYDSFHSPNEWEQRFWPTLFQLDVLHERLAIHRLAADLALAGKIVLEDRSLWGDITFARMLNRSGHIPDVAYRIYLKAVRNACVNLPPPTTIIFFDVQPETALARICKRDRPQERGITLEYLRALSEEYRRLLKEAKYAAYPWSHAVDVVYTWWDPDTVGNAWDPIAMQIQKAIKNRELPDYMRSDVLYPAGRERLDGKRIITWHEELAGK